MQDDVMFKDLDAILMTRRTPEVPMGLSERIIAAAARADEQMRMNPEAQKRGRWLTFLKELSTEMEDLLAIPKPALVIASLLVLALSAGTYTEYVNASLMPGVTTNDLSTFMSIDDRFVASEFLGSEETL